ncbi:Transposase [Cordylochernes scorpioides]|uniref:Transposase n=1 Tax=Cordylochernes scorpioides TaxID=51811 RepID=A0ABY6LHG4_9ARAC|nr:Transposase [Cordylochernes scorpioides]
MPGHRKRRQFKQRDALTRGMVIGLKRAGWSIRQIAADTHLGASTVHRLWRRWLEQGNVAIYRNVGATRVTSARVDRRILRQAVAASKATCTAILQHVQDTLDHSVSIRTISRRLVANGLHSCRPLRRLPLTPPNRRQRLEWCRARSTWMTEWHRVVFSDESRFCLSSDSRRVRVWRRRGERSNPAAIVERPTVRQRGIMVWGAIAYDSRSPLLRIQGTMTAQRYVDDVLRPVTLPYLQGVPNDLYQHDNARPHTASISQQALQDVQMLPWPPYSPDLSPIEHVWDIIGRRLHALPQPRSEDELWQMVEREWRAIPQDAIRTLIDSLPRRVVACIAVRVPRAKIAGGPDLYVEAGSDINLTCTISQSPDMPAFVFWFHDDRMINYDGRRSISLSRLSHDRVQSSLLIRDAQLAYSGNYTCSSSNAEPVTVLVHVVKAIAAALQKIAMDPEQKLHTPNIVNIATVVIEMHGDI